MFPNNEKVEESPNALVNGRTVWEIAKDCNNPGLVMGWELAGSNLI